MPRTLLWRLLAINLLVVGIAVGVTALTIGSLANSIFANLMKEFHIQVDVMHRLFVAAMARSLVLVSLIAGGVGLLLSVILFRRVVDPVRRMMAMAERIAAGDYAARARVGASDEIGRLAESLNRMAALVRRLVDLRRVECAAKGITLQSRTAVNGAARADPDLLSQALHNLIDNAVKYTPAGGEVRVEVARVHGGQVGAQSRDGLTSVWLTLPGTPS